MYYSPNIIWMTKSRRMTCMGHVACMGEGRGVYRVLAGKPEEKRPHGRPRRGWEHIKMDLQEVEWEGMDWIDLARKWDRWSLIQS